MSNKKTESKLPLYCLYAIPLALLLALILGPIIRQGMFIDGLVYTNIAKNMAAGDGSLWQPVLDVGAPVFYEHPALIPWVHSFFFRLIGDTIYTEDVFNFTVLSLTLFLMYRIWALLVPRADRKLFFYPFLLFVASQEVQLRYPNAMLECGMTLVLVATAYVYIRLAQTETQRARLGSWLAVGIGTFLATLCKGPTGLFLLVLPVLYDLIINGRRSVLALVVPALVTVAAFGILFALQPEALTFATHYLDQQVVSALRGERTENIAKSRFAILVSLVKANLPAVVVSALLIFIPSGKSVSKRAGYVLLLVGLCGVLPIMLSIKQASYYQIPALPFLILGVSLVLMNQIRFVYQFILSSNVTRIILYTVAPAGLIASFIVATSMYGTVDRRDRKAMEDAHQIAEIMNREGIDQYNFVTPGFVVGEASHMSYSIPGFLNRFHHIYYSDREKKCFLVMVHHHNFLPPYSFETLYKADKITMIRSASEDNNR